MTTTIIPPSRLRLRFESGGFTAYRTVNLPEGLVFSADRTTPVVRAIRDDRLVARRDSLHVYRLPGVW